MTPFYDVFKGFPGGSVIMNIPADAGDAGSIPALGISPGVGNFPGVGNGYHSSILAWETPRTEGSGRLKSLGSQRVGHNLATKHQHCV